jgi:hypothetical protein
MDTNRRHCTHPQRKEYAVRLRRIPSHRLLCLLQQLRQRGNQQGLGRIVARTTSESPEHAPAVALIRAGHRIHTAMEEAGRTRLGFLRLTKSG